MQNDQWQDKATEASATVKDTAQEVKQTAVETIGAARDEVKKVAGTVTEQAKHALGELQTEVKDQAVAAAAQVKQQAEGKLDEQRQQAAERLSGVASALRETGQRLSGKSEDMVGQYAQSMADQVDRFSSYLRDRDTNELLGEIQDFARRQPELFVAGTLAAGFLLGRFLKSSSQRREVERFGAPNAQTVGQTTAYARGAYQPVQSAFADRSYGSPQRASDWKEEGNQWNNR